MKKNRNIFTEEKANSVFATKLRKLFAASGRTHGNLADYIKERTGDSVTRQAIGQWCNGNTSPNLKTVPLIASFFRVSVDYLLTETEVKAANLDVKAICEYTGLSEQSVYIMHEEHKEGNGTNVATVINLLARFDELGILELIQSLVRNDLKVADGDVLTNSVLLVDNSTTPNLIYHFGAEGIKQILKFEIMTRLDKFSDKYRKEQNDNGSNNPPQE